MRARVNRGPTRDEAIEIRLADMYDAFSSGQGEDTGKLIYDYVDPSGWDRGAVVGRIPGVKPAFPESMQLSEGPGRIAKAIREKKGVTYERIRHAVGTWADRQDFAPTRKRKSAPPTVPAHKGRASCSHCGQLHTTGQHRFHGKGAFHRTHLWAFNSMKPSYTPHVEFRPTVRQAEDIIHHATKYGVKGMDRDLLAKARAKLRQVRKPVSNPRRKVTARRAKPNPRGTVIGYVEKLYYRRTVGQHRGYYQHTFKTRAEVVALPNGTVLLRPAK